MIDAGKVFQVDGQLIARGNQGNEIIFTAHSSSPAPGYWGPLRFNDSSVDATVDGANLYLNGSALEYSKVSYSTSVEVLNSSPFIASNTIQYNSTGVSLSNSSSVVRNNSILNNTGNGISGEKDGNLMILNNIVKNNAVGIAFPPPNTGTCTLSGNKIELNSSGGILFTNSGQTSQGSAGNLALLVENNTITQNQGVGLRINGYWFNQVITATVSTNIFSNNSGTGIIIIGNSSGTTEANIVNNTIEQNHSGGLEFLTYSIFSQKPRIIATLANNDIKFNTGTEFSGLKWGLVGFYALEIRNNNITNNDGPKVIKAGLASNCHLNNNNIDSNTGYSFLLEMLENSVSGAPNLDAANNWWGASDTVAIENLIFDEGDDFYYGDAVISPVLASPEPTAGP